MSNSVGVFNVAVEAVIVRDGKILITQRSFERPHAPGEWEILTGRVVQGETFQEAVAREVMEEVGLKVDVGQPFNTFHFYRGPEKAEHLGVSFLCTYKGGEVQLDQIEQVDYRWATPEEALELIKDLSIRTSIQRVQAILKTVS
jgi:8-oxo-dGTP diphosphatase